MNKINVMILLFILGALTVLTTGCGKDPDKELPNYATIRGSNR